MLRLWIGEYRSSRLPVRCLSPPLSLALPLALCGPANSLLRKIKPATPLVNSVTSLNMRILTVVFMVAPTRVVTARVIHPTQVPNSIPQVPLQVDIMGNDGATRLIRNLLLPATAFRGDDLANPADWETFSLKGSALMCALEGTDQTAGRLIKDTRNPPSAATSWSSDLKQELHDWYWRELNPTSKGGQLDDYWKFAGMMQALGLNGKSTSTGGDNACYRIEHWDPDKEENGNQVLAINQWYHVGGHNYRVSLGS
jgi:hypothetical protein